VNNGDFLRKGGQKYEHSNDQKGRMLLRANKVNTQIAYKKRGIDVADLEKRNKKLKELNLK